MNMFKMALIETVFVMLSIVAVHAEVSSDAQLALDSSAKVCAVFPDGIGCGTGVFVGKGKLITDYHVVQPHRVTVKTSGGVVTIVQVPLVVVLLPGTFEWHKATVIGFDDSRDLAIIETDLRGRVSKPIDPIPGDTFIAVGNPAVGDFVVVASTVNGTMPWVMGDRKRVVFMIQVDSAGVITHGFSGGGLFTRGGFIGVTDMCHPVIPICLATPASEIRAFIEKYIKKDGGK